MPTREELEAQVRRKRLEEQVREKRASPMASPNAAEDYINMRSGMLSPILTPVSKVSQAVQSYTTAPVMEGLATWQDTGDLGEGLAAAGRQFGEDPSKARTGKDVMGKMGFSSAETVPMGLIMNPWAQTKDERMLYASPAGLAGGALETVADPTTLAMSALTGGAGYVAPKLFSKMAPGAVEALGKVGTTAAKYGGKGVLGMPMEMTGEYIQNAERVNRMKGVTPGMLAKDAMYEKNILETGAQREANAAKEFAQERKQYETEARLGAKETQRDELATARLGEAEQRGLDQSDIQSKRFAAQQSHRDTVQSAKERLTSAKADLDQKYKTYLDQTRQGGDTRQGALEIGQSMDNAKATLGELSEQADEALANSNIVAPKKALTDPIRQAAADIRGKAATPETMAMADKLEASADLIDSNFGEHVSGPEIRSIMRDIRARADFGLESGQFDELLSRQRKAVSERMSSALKQYSPEYADYMRQMSGMASSLDDMRKMFGTEQRGIGTLERAAKGGSQAERIQELLRSYGEVSGSPEVGQVLERIKGKQGQLEAARTGTLKQQAFPSELENVSEAENTLSRLSREGTDAAEVELQREALAQEISRGREHAARQRQAGERFSAASEEAKARSARDAEYQQILDEQAQESGETVEKLSRLTSEGGEQLFRRAGRPNAPEADRATLSTLRGAGPSGRNFGREARDVGILGEFGKDVTHGSRLTNLGGMVGSLAGEGGKAVGAGLGAAADKFGRRALKGGIDTGMRAQKTLRAVANAMQTNPELLGKFQKVLGAAGAAGGGGITAYHHVLYSNNPEYREIVDKMMED